MPDGLILTLPKAKGQKTPAEIWARDGLGPIDWLELAKKFVISFSLVDFWQVSPEGTYYFKKLLTYK